MIPSRRSRSQVPIIVGTPTVTMERRQIPNHFTSQLSNSPSRELPLSLPTTALRSLPPAAMALPSSFQERLHQMEETRNQRLSLLQAEKQLQIKKSRLLSEKLAILRCAEQRCLLLEKRNAELGFQILAKKTEIDGFDAQYQAKAQELRVLRCELDEVEGREKERDGFYEAKRLEMEEFNEKVKKRLSGVRSEVQKMKSCVSQLKSTLNDLQGNDGYLNNAEIAAAETRKAEFLVIKADLDKCLASNYELRALLQKQLQKILISQNKERENVNQTMVVEHDIIKID